MASSSEISPWSSGSWHFNPKEVSLAQRQGPIRRRNWQRSDQQESVSKVSRKLYPFGKLPEEELLRMGYITLFAFSGFLLAVLTIVLMSY